MVAKARRYFKTKRVGHAGTLDPMASGVLIVLIGEATKLSQSLTLERKSYRATVKFGTSTDSDDAEGTVLREASLPEGLLTAQSLEVALQTERERTVQIPPVVTAIKQEGRKAYELHRKGLAVEVLPRDVHVFDLTLEDHTTNTATLHLTVSKGYYVRSLARDLGQALGVPAHLSALRRTSSGQFTLDEAVAWPPATPPTLLTLENVAARVLSCMTLTPEGVLLARVGKRLGPEHLVADPQPLDARQARPVAGQTSAWLSPEGVLVALGTFDAEGTGQVLRGFTAHQPSEGTEGKTEKSLQAPT